MSRLNTLSDRESKCITFGYCNCSNTFLLTFQEIKNFRFRFLFDSLAWKSQIYHITISKNIFIKYICTQTHGMECHRNLCEFRLKDTQAFLVFLGEQRYHITPFYVIASHFRYHLSNLHKCSQNPQLADDANVNSHMSG